ncbi:hypothetical protein BT96DRAFT_989317 [Gymnopus androsaceus JB14]|uniref:Uncharacterized protein n=1 Tax=Gymnopus androsaceus JB14 TaxID=1447944 RepID=A0A6A4I281_9AGAR|nr:hypothetical protein BT96DRAFT_989317 [Gymnopus androsaceus JB14]
MTELVDNQLPPEVTRKLSWLRLLSNSLPAALPTPQKEEIPKYPFKTFRPDPAFLQRTGSEVGAINETMKNIFGWKTRTTGDGIIPIEERGKYGIGAAADFLYEPWKSY